MTDVKANFSSKYDDVSCIWCPNLAQTDCHLIECSKIIENCPELNGDNETEYQDLFDDIDSQVRAIKIFKAVFKTKEKLEESVNLNCS